MFTKLLKHEFKSTARIMTILSIAVLVTGIIATMLLRLMQSVPSWNLPELTSAAIISSLTLLLVACFIGVIAFTVGTTVILLTQFYRSKFTDQGYLTFTLPAKSSQILLSAYVNALIWVVIGFLVTLVAVLTVIVFGTTTEGLLNTEVLTALMNGLGEIISAMRMMDPFSVVVLPIYGIISLLAGIMLYLAVITLGCVIAKTHKVLVSFALYYAINTALGTITGVTQFITMMSHIEDTSFSTMYLPQTIIMAGVLVGGYFLTTYLMKNKLNLP